MSIVVESVESGQHERDNISMVSGDSIAVSAEYHDPDAVSNHTSASSASMSLVMKYAESEKRCIQLGKERDELQRSLASLTKDKNELAERVEQVKAESQQRCAELQQELDSYRRENDKLREEKIMAESRFSVMQGAKLNLSKEAELANAAREQLAKENEALAKKISELSAVARPPEPAAVRSNHAESQPSDKSAQLQRELTVLNSQLRDMFEERTSLRDSIKCLQQERASLETSLDKHKKDLDNMTNLYKMQSEEAAKMRTTVNELKKSRNERIESQQKMAALSNELSELQAELLANRAKQEELLLFTSRLTEKNIEMKSENQALDESLQKLNAEHDRLAMEYEELKAAVASNQEREDRMRDQLEETEQVEKRLSNEIDSLKEQLEMKESELNDTKILLMDEKDENSTLKKKHAAIVKDMGRQLQMMQKKLDSSASSQQESRSEPETSSLTCYEYSAFGFHETNNNLVNSSELSMLMAACNTSSPMDDASKYYAGDVKKLFEKTMKLQNELEDKEDQIELLLNKIRDLTLKLASRPPKPTGICFDDQVEIRM